MELSQRGGPSSTAAASAKDPVLHINSSSYHDKASGMLNCRNNIELVYNDSNNKLINNNKTKYELESLEKPKHTNNHILLGGKHPVGLEAIKEITRNTHPSDSSQM